MARVLICEPQDDIRSLLELVVTRLGHVPVVHRGGPVLDDAVQAAIVEPGDEGGLQLAEALHAARVPLVLASIFPPGTPELALEPVAYLVKPFPLFELEEAVRAALGCLDPEPAAA